MDRMDKIEIVDICASADNLEYFKFVIKKQG